MPHVVETTDAAASSSTTYLITPGTTVAGTLSSTGDNDGFRVVLEAGRTYTFSMVGTGTNAVEDPLIYLLNSSGARVGEDDDGGNGQASLLTYTPTRSGTYVIVASSFGNEGSGGYGLSVTAGDTASYSIEMGAGALTVSHLHWGAGGGQPANVTWAPRASNSDQTDSDGNDTAFIRASSAQIAAFTAATAAIAEVSGLTFTRVSGYTNNATIRVGAYDAEDASAAYANLPGSTSNSSNAGDVSINNNYTSATSLPRGSYDFITILHELGHAVGLSHPGEYNAAVGVDITYDNNAVFTQDSTQYTIMSYFDEAETSGRDIPGSPDTLLLYDILALQNLYGANYSTRANNSVYGFKSNTGDVYDFTKNTIPFLTIWDGGGTDTLNVSGYSQDQLIDLRAGNFSNIGGYVSNVSIAYGVVIERAIGGSGDDLIYGNNANNVLSGGPGKDLMIGGRGDDTYYIDDVGDFGRESSNQGNDTVIASISFAIGANIENLMLGSTAVNGTGNSVNNVIVGNSRDNILIGNRGADTLTGGRGSDTFKYSNTNESTLSLFDRITDLSNEDRIDLSAIDANTTLSGNQAFSIVDAFTSRAGQITLDYSASTRLTTILMDVNGDGVADMKIVANGDHEDFTGFIF